METDAAGTSTQPVWDFTDPRRDLNALDRCDVCGARAWVRAVMRESELLFCAHHGSAHIEALLESAIFVQDDRELLLDRSN